MNVSPEENKKQLKTMLLICILSANIGFSILPISTYMGGMFPIRIDNSFFYKSGVELYEIGMMKYYLWYIFASLSLISFLIFYSLFIILYRKSSSFKIREPNLGTVVKNGVIKTHNRVDVFIKDIEPRYYKIALLIPIQLFLAFLLPIIKAILINHGFGK